MRALHAQVTTLASQLRARPVLPLYTAAPAHPGPGPGTSATLVQVGTVRDNFSGTVYVATPALLAGYGIKQNEIGASTDILTMRPGLAAAPDMQLTSCFSPPVSGYMCPAATISDPVVQTFGSLPSGMPAPNTVLTMHAVQALHATILLSRRRRVRAHPPHDYQCDRGRARAAWSRARLGGGLRRDRSLGADADRRG